MTVKVNASVVVDNSNNINWSFLTNIPATLVTSATTTGTPSTQRLISTTSITGGVIILRHA